MSLRFLVDTNVLSEPLKPNPDPQILDLLREHADSTALAAVSWHELVFGASRLPPSRCRKAIEDYLETVVRLSFPILPYTEEAAAWHGRERARLQAEGRTPSFVDGQIAATARVHDLVLVTGNQKHFQDFAALKLVDWRSEQ